MLENMEEERKSVKEEEEDRRNTMQVEVINDIKKSQKRGENYRITYEIPIFLILKYSIPCILELSDVSLITPTKRKIFTHYIHLLCSSYTCSVLHSPSSVRTCVLVG